MQLLLDHLSALIVSAVIIMTLTANQYRSQHATIEQTASHSVKAKTIVFGQWLEHDVLNLGANFGRNTYRFEEPTLDAEGNTALWTFYSDSVKTDGSRLRQIIRYRLEETTQATFQDTTFQLFVVHRDSVAMPVASDGSVAVPAESAWTRQIRSIGTLSFFRIEMVDRWGQTPRQGDGSVDIDEVDYVRVRFGVVPEYVLKPDNYLRELYWVRLLKVRPYWVPPPALSS